MRAGGATLQDIAVANVKRGFMAQDRVPGNSWARHDFAGEYTWSFPSARISICKRKGLEGEGGVDTAGVATEKTITRPKFNVLLDVGVVVNCYRDDLVPRLPIATVPRGERRMRSRCS